MSSLGRYRVVDSKSFGLPLKKGRRYETIQFIIHGFEEAREIHSELKSGRLRAIEQYWHLKYVKASSECLLLNYNSRVGIQMRARLRCKEVDSEFENVKIRADENIPVVQPLKIGDDITKHLDEKGRLVIEADIECEDETYGIWFPREISRNDELVELYHDASPEPRDAFFAVGERIFGAHKSVLATRCKRLYELANEYDDDAPIPLQFMIEEVFETILRFVYTVNTEPWLRNKKFAIEVLVAADRLECVPLKLYAESILVGMHLYLGNSMSLLILSDSHSCALLKEAAIGLFAKNSKHIRSLASFEAWSQVKESKDLLYSLLVGGIVLSPIAGEAERIDRMTVFNLRKELEYANQDLDGSREILMNRLKAYRQQRKDNGGENSAS